MPFRFFVAAEIDRPEAQTSAAAPRKLDTRDDVLRTRPVDRYCSREIAAPHTGRKHDRRCYTTLPDQRDSILGVRLSS